MQEYVGQRCGRDLLSSYAADDPVHFVGRIQTAAVKIFFPKKLDQVSGKATRIEGVGASSVPAIPGHTDPVVITTRIDAISSSMKQSSGNLGDSLNCDHMAIVRFDADLLNVPHGTGRWPNFLLESPYRRLPQQLKMTRTNDCTRKLMTPPPPSRDALRLILIEASPAES
jgi:hypothetical protein